LKPEAAALLHEHMFSPADVSLWLLTTLVEAFVVYLFLTRGVFRKFLFLNLYLISSILIRIGRFAVLFHSGIASAKYAYSYYFTDTLMAILLFLGISELAVRLFETKEPRRRMVFVSAVALVATALFNLLFESWRYGVATVFVVELSRNFYFASGLTTVLLWVWKLRNDPEDRTADRVVGVLSVYFLLFFLIYGARQLAPHATGLDNVVPMIGAWLPIGCGFVLVSRRQP
jgi:hypothetical protein